MVQLKIWDNLGEVFCSFKGSIIAYSEVLVLVVKEMLWHLFPSVNGLFGLKFQVIYLTNAATLVLNLKLRYVEILSLFSQTGSIAQMVEFPVAGIRDRVKDWVNPYQCEVSGFSLLVFGKLSL